MGTSYALNDRLDPTLPPAGHSLLEEEGCFVLCLSKQFLCFSTMFSSVSIFAYSSELALEELVVS